MTRESKKSATARKWGRWEYDGVHLTFISDVGTLDPQWYVPGSTIQSQKDIDQMAMHLSEKVWIGHGDIVAFEQACKAILEETFVNEELLDVPQAVPYEAYHKATDTQWRDFLDQADPDDESLFQKFIERHPCLLPGPYGVPGGRYHGSRHSFAISQPELPGIRVKRPDFLVVEQDSATVYVILIEIEAPGKRWCTNDGHPTADLTRAIDQIRDWRSWFSDSTNMAVFEDTYQLGKPQRGNRRLMPQYVLIYGRRDDATKLESFAAKRHDFNSEDEFVMSYDRLQASGQLALTVRIDRTGPDTRFRALKIAPSFHINTRNAGIVGCLTGMEEAIDDCEGLEDLRRSFLKKRVELARRFCQEKRIRPQKLPWIYEGW